MPDSERSLAVFIDFENLALGFQGRRERFEIGRVIERLVEKGKIIVKKVFAERVQLGVKIDKSLLKRVKLAAVEDEKTLEQWVAEALELKLDSVPGL